MENATLLWEGGAENSERIAPRRSAWSSVGRSQADCLVVVLYQYTRPATQPAIRPTKCERSLEA
jgi:hypothetical protein